MGGHSPEQDREPLLFNRVKFEQRRRPSTNISTATMARALEPPPDGLNRVVAKLIELFGHLDGPQFLEAGKAGAFARDQVKR